MTYTCPPNFRLFILSFANTMGLNPETDFTITPDVLNYRLQREGIDPKTASEWTIEEITNDLEKQLQAFKQFAHEFDITRRQWGESNNIEETLREAARTHVRSCITCELQYMNYIRQLAIAYRREPHYAEHPLEDLLPMVDKDIFHCYTTSEAREIALSDAQSFE